MRSRLFGWLRNVNQGVLRRWLPSGPTAGFNSLVVLATIGVISELYGDSFPQWLKLVAITLVILLSSLVFFVQFKRPAMDAEDEYRVQLMSILFNVIVERYRHENPDDYDLRINVMQVRRNLIGMPHFLKIDYSTNDYRAVELDQKYEIGTACCGWAFEENAQTIFDKDTIQEALRGMTDAQREATAHVHSILSTPIYRNGRLDDPIGVLSLDSMAPIAKTKFDDNTLQDLVAEHAIIVGAFLR